MDDPTSADVTIANNVEHFVRSVVVSRVIMAQSINGDTNSTHFVDPLLNSLREIEQADEHYRTLIKWIQHDFPSVHTDTTAGFHLGPIYRGRKANPSGAMVEVVKKFPHFFLHNFLYIVICT